MGFVGAEAWKRSLMDDLASPPFSCEVDELAALWSVRSVRFVCARPALMQDYPELSMRLRGAWGHKLAEMGPVERRGFSMPRPYEVLFAPLGKWASGLEVPKPAVIRGWIDGEALIAEVHLFGWGDVYLDQAAAALAAALEEGVSLGSGVRQRVPVEVVDAGERACGLVEVPGQAGSAVLSFRTPVVVRNVGRLRQNPTAVLKSLLLRVSGMARWQGYDLQADWRALHERIEALTIDVLDLDDTAWERHSIRRGDSAIPMHGLLGKLRLSGNLIPLLPFLAIAETCNTGSHAALGLGWFDLAVYP
jgi:hypothetical protein